jgi:transportin-3
VGYHCFYPIKDSAYKIQGVTATIQTQVFNCVRSWVNSGVLLVSSLSDSPLLEYAFQALVSDELFDAAVDLICDVIHETQEVEENMSVVQLIIPRVMALRGMLAVHKEESDRIRGYTRIFSEAGEVYRTLLLQAPDQFLPIVEAIAECTAYHDLDVVPITFNFWWRLSQSLGKRQVVPPVLIEAYSALVEIIIRHLHFPSDPSSMTGQEADEFRSFRHVMGDTLKDCCHVLGTDKCLTRAYEMIMAAISHGGTNVQWQAIEAPLFSMRSMGAEIDLADDKIIPKIMDLMPNLPSHPRVRYAALLVMSRYSEWTNEHPSYIPFQLQYISAGFDDADVEVPAAAGLAMKYLCRDCKRVSALSIHFAQVAYMAPKHLLSYMPQLHAFLNTVNGKLVQDDMCQICEAVAYVVSSQPLQEAAEWLKTLSSDILSKVHTVVAKPGQVTKDDLQNICSEFFFIFH